MPCLDARFWCFLACIVLFRSEIELTSVSATVRNATDREFPHVVFIHVETSNPNEPIACTGAIVNDVLALTSCSCLADLNSSPVRVWPTAGAQVIAGSIFKNASEGPKTEVQVKTPTAFFVHPKCEAQKLPTGNNRVKNDVGVVQIDRVNPFVFNDYVKPVSLPPLDRKKSIDFYNALNSTEAKCQIISWDMTTSSEDNKTALLNTSDTEILKVADVFLLSADYCEASDAKNQCAQLKTELNFNNGYIGVTTNRAGPAIDIRSPGGPLMCSGKEVDGVSTLQIPDAIKLKVYIFETFRFTSSYVSDQLSKSATTSTVPDTPSGAINTETSSPLPVWTIRRVPLRNGLTLPSRTDGFLLFGTIFSARHMTAKI